MELKDLGVLYIDNPINYTQEVEAVLEKLFKNYLEIKRSRFVKKPN